MTEKHGHHTSNQDTSDDPVSDSAITQVVERIVQEVHPLQIILFGSVAQGHDDRQSDLDLLVVMPEGTHKRQTAHRLYRSLGGLAVPVDVLVTTPADLDRHRDNPGLIYRTILQEGKLLYDA